MIEDGSQYCPAVRNVPRIASMIEQTPAFVLDEGQIVRNLKPLQFLRQATGCKVLYSIKALPLFSLLTSLRTEIDGLSVSSLFEARLAHEALAGVGSIHVTTPGLRAHEFVEMASLSSHIAFNSLSQYQHLQGLASDYSRGLRINPRLSFLDDDRYDPCRTHSKLGVAIEQLQAGLPDGVEGLHFHTVYACRSFAPLLRTLQTLLPLIAAHPQIRWLNIGGGYRYDLIGDQAPMIERLQALQRRFGLTVYLEPGKAIVGNAGYLFSRVIDRFDSDGKTLLVLDTSVNHHPEVFEYQRKPDLLEEDPLGTCRAILTGSTCKAGDVFGEYRFSVMPDMGDVLTFNEVGAYALIKANRFNGYNLPDVYTLCGETLTLQKRHDYDDYRMQWGGGRYDVC